MDNQEIARTLYEIAQLLQLREDNPFKIRAYLNAARSLEHLSEAIQDVVACQRLEEIPGVGKAIARKIEELVTTGQLQFYETLKEDVPLSLLELFHLPNLGPKKIKLLHDQLGISGLKELEYACLENRLLALKGFGEKTQGQILEGITLLSTYDGQHLLGKALPAARELLAYLRTCKAIEGVELAGGARRWREIIKGLNFVASSSHPSEVAEYFRNMPFAATLLSRGDNRCSMRLANGLQVDLRVVGPEEFATALHHFTGSTAHNAAMLGYARRLGYTINAHGVFKEGSERPVTINSEEDLFALFNMDYIPPEMRENLGEIEAALAHRIPSLVERSQLQGIFHVHSLWSDGHDTLEEMVRAAQDQGYRYIGISEHSKAAAYANGLNEVRLAQQGQEIDRLNQQLGDIKILKGIEVDILADGTLDLSEAALARLDFVIASIHSGFKMEEREMTARICRALANPHVHILGHATGHLLLGRKGYAVNLEEVLKTAAKHNTCIEINANPHRLDLEWTAVRKAKAMGVKMLINPDAHRIGELDYVEFGVGVARKGWASPGDILNTLSWETLKAYFEGR